MFVPITDVDLLDLVVELQDDPSRRWSLADGSKFHEAAAAAGLISRTDQNGFALSVGHAYQRGLLDFGSTAGGSHLRAPDDGPWTDHAVQSRYYYEPTPAGRELVLTQRRLRRLAATDGGGSGDPSLNEARRLLAEGSRVEAVVEAVEGVLADCLRSLAARHGVATERADGGRPLGLGELNNGLRGAGVYSVADQTQIQAWLHLRNQLAHRRPDAPDDRRIGLLIDGVELFTSEHAG